VRLYVNGYLRIDQWGNLWPNTGTVDVFLSTGDHEIKVELVEYGGDASISLSWAAVSGANCYDSVPAERWKGEYYSNTNLAGSPARVSNDGGGFLSADFGGGPGSGCGLGVDYFSARWTRTINFAASTYRFSVTGDDGVRLYVGGDLLINKWFLQGPTTYTAEVTFMTSGPYQVKLEHFENNGGVVALLSWADVTGVNCVPNVPQPLISSVQQTDGSENIASTAPSEAPKRCGQKNSD
jgi:PA14 domain